MLNCAEDNEARVIGTCISEAELSHEVKDEEIYNFYLKISRLSENFDTLVITIFEKLLSRTKE